MAGFRWASARRPGSPTAVLDVSDEAQCLDFAARVRAEWNLVDVLVNAAGWFPLTPFEEVTYAQWREIIAVNLDGPFSGDAQLAAVAQSQPRGSDHLL